MRHGTVNLCPCFIPPSFINHPGEQDETPPAGKYIILGPGMFTKIMRDNSGRVKYGSAAFLKLKPLLLPFRLPSTVGVGVPGPRQESCWLGQRVPSRPLSDLGWVSNADDLKVPSRCKILFTGLSQQQMWVFRLSVDFPPNWKSPSFMRLENSVINTQSLKFTLCDVTNRTDTVLD